EVQEVERRVARALLDDAVDERRRLDEAVAFDEQACTEVVEERVAAGQDVVTNDQDVCGAHGQPEECGREQAAPKGSGRHGRHGSDPAGAGAPRVLAHPRARDRVSEQPAATVAPPWLRAPRRLRPTRLAAATTSRSS